MKTAALLALATLCLSAHSQTIGSGVTLGAGVTIGSGTVVVVIPPPPPPTNGFTFTPGSGTYTGTGTKNVSITDSHSGSGTSIFYTANGFPATEATTLYTGSTIPVSSTTTINALLESTGTVRQNTGSTLSGHKLCAPLTGSQGSPAAVHCGGVGSTQPSTWSITTDGTTMKYSISSTSGAPQLLYTLSGSPCDGCTKMTQHFKLEPVLNTHMQNIEADMWWNNGSQNRLVMFGFQCNQQPGKLNWQVDNEQGEHDGTTWQNTGITDHCPLPTGVYTDVVLEGHWSNSDLTGCSQGLGCEVFDNVYINGVKHVLNISRSKDNPGWASGCANQKQLDLNPGGTVASPFTASYWVQEDNVTCSFGTVDTGAATYTY